MGRLLARAFTAVSRVVYSSLLPVQLLPRPVYWRLHLHTYESVRPFLACACCERLERLVADFTSDCVILKYIFAVAQSERCLPFRPTARVLNQILLCLALQYRTKYDVMLVLAAGLSIVYSPYFGDVCVWHGLIRLLLRHASLPMQ